MADFNEVANQFVTFYYNTFDSDRANLVNLYRDNSMLTFESDAIMGAQAIIQKLTTLGFQKVSHRIDTLDAQPSNPEGGVLVLVTGVLLVDEEERPMKYTQTFQLLKEGDTYFVFNDVFKLIFG